jgi:hypothetical protein
MAHPNFEYTITNFNIHPDTLMVTDFEPLANKFLTELQETREDVGSVVHSSFDLTPDFTVDTNYREFFFDVQEELIATRAVVHRHGVVTDIVHEVRDEVKATIVDTAELMIAAFGEESLSAGRIFNNSKMVFTGTDLTEFFTTGDAITIFAGLDNSNDSWVQAVYKNVVGVEATEGEIDLYSGLLDDGTYTRTSLLQAAADLDAVSAMVDDSFGTAVHYAYARGLYWTIDNTLENDYSIDPITRYYTPSDIEVVGTDMLSDWVI